MLTLFLVAGGVTKTIQEPTRKETIPIRKLFSRRTPTFQKADSAEANFSGLALGQKRQDHFPQEETDVKNILGQCF